MRALLCVLGSLLAGQCFASDVMLVYQLPCYQSVAGKCMGEDSAHVETKLKLVHFWAYRFSGRDSLYLGSKSEVGRECQDDSVKLSFDDKTWGGTVIVKSEDQAGNVSCRYASALFVTPHAEAVAPPDTVRPAGLYATYFDKTDFSGPTVIQVDSLIDFVSAGTLWPSRVVGPLAFSVRWTGYLRLPFDGACTVCTYFHGGARLWVGGVPLVDSWPVGGTRKLCGTATLVSGRAVPLQLEYQETQSLGQIKLLWTDQGGTERTVPATALEH